MSLSALFLLPQTSPVKFFFFWALRSDPFPRTFTEMSAKIVEKLERIESIVKDGKENCCEKSRELQNNQVEDRLTRGASATLQGHQVLRRQRVPSGVSSRRILKAESPWRISSAKAHCLASRSRDRTWIRRSTRGPASAELSPFVDSH